MNGLASSIKNDKQQGFILNPENFCIIEFIISVRIQSSPRWLNGQKVMEYHLSCIILG
jgi:hypothetical protein